MKEVNKLVDTVYTHIIFEFFSKARFFNSGVSRDRNEIRKQNLDNFVTNLKECCTSTRSTCSHTYLLAAVSDHTKCAPKICFRSRSSKCVFLNTRNCP